MSLNSEIKTLKPGRSIEFTVPNPVNHRCHLRTPRIRIRVLDSPVAFTGNGIPKIAALIVPENRETDWLFCTDTGHRQVLFEYANLSRLILIGNNLPPNQPPCIYTRPPDTDTDDRKKLEDELQHLVLSLHPKVCFKNGLPKPLFLRYEDDLLYRELVATFVGPIVGEFLVEDVLMEVHDDSVDKKFARNLRFKRTPDVIQSQVHLDPFKDTGELITAEINLESLTKMKKKKNVKYEIDRGLLVHPFLTPMASGLFLITSDLSERIRLGFTPRALCLGVGGGSLLSFLNAKMGFQVVGVESDDVVLNVAKQYFGLDAESIHLIVGDAIDVIQNFPLQQTKANPDDSDSEAKFDVVMVDLDSDYGFSVPPPEFVKKSVFQAIKSLLHDHGLLIINVVPLTEQFSNALIRQLKAVFHNVCKIDVEQEGSFVLIATLSEPNGYRGHTDTFFEKLRHAIDEEEYMDDIYEL